MPGVPRNDNQLASWQTALSLTVAAMLIVGGVGVVMMKAGRIHDRQAAVVRAEVLSSRSSVERQVHRNMAVYDSLLTLKGARQDGPGGKYIETGIYNWSGRNLLETIEIIEQARNVAPPDYIGLAELARTTFGPRYHEFQDFTTDDLNDGNGKDQYLLAQLGAKYAAVLELGLGQATRK
jgi:hypothetical protein